MLDDTYHLSDIIKTIDFRVIYFRISLYSIFTYIKLIDGNQEMPFLAEIFCIFKYAMETKDTCIYEEDLLVGCGMSQINIQRTYREIDSKCPNLPGTTLATFSRMKYFRNFLKMAKSITIIKLLSSQDDDQITICEYFETYPQASLRSSSGIGISIFYSIFLLRSKICPIICHFAIQVD